MDFIKFEAEKKYPSGTGTEVKVPVLNISERCPALKMSQQKE